MPSDSTRKAYIRAFKWAVAFATWRYSRSDEEAFSGAQREKAMGLNGSGADEEGPASAWEIAAAAAAAGLKSGASFSLSLAANGSPLSSPSKQQKKISASAIASRQHFLATRGLPGAQFGSPIKKPSADDSSKILTERIQGEGKRAPGADSPYSQKRAVSEMRRLDALRKGQKLAKEKTVDEKLQDTLKEYDRFYQKHRHEASWV